MEYPDDKPSEIIIHKTCNCDLVNYYCFCNGEDKLLEELKIPKFTGVIYLKPNIDCYAIMNGHLNILKWLHSQNFHLDFFSLEYAAMSGQMEILMWLHSLNFSDLLNGCVCSGAARHGHLNILIWLRSQNPPYPFNKYCCVNAAENGHLEVFKWLVNNNAPFKPTFHEINIHCLEYLFIIEKTHPIKNKINLQQIERLKILTSCVF